MVKKTILSGLVVALAATTAPAMAAAAPASGFSYGTQGENQLASPDADLPYFEFSREAPNSFSAEIRNGSASVREDGAVDILDAKGVVAYSLHTDGVTPEGVPAEYEYDVADGQLIATWREAPGQAPSVQTYGGVDQYGLPADPKAKAACLASALGLGFATASVIIATGGTGAALAAAGISYVTAGGGVALSC